MPNYKRAYGGSTYFFTVVTHKRRPFLCDAMSRAMLREAINETRTRWPFAVDAWVLLPDHLHCIWTLPDGDVEYSTRWGRIKSGFSKRINSLGVMPDSQRSASRQKRRESAYWQRRFWEHEIKSQRDYNAHMDYIHFNPVKHGYVKSPRDWEYSSFHRLVKEGVYDINWGGAQGIDFTGIGHE